MGISISGFTKQSSRRGFTIVELLIVIVVIAILAAITVVAFSGIRARALDSDAKSKLNTVNKAIVNFHTLSGRYPGISELTGLSGAQLIGFKSTSEVEPAGIEPNRKGTGIEAGYANNSSVSGNLYYVAFFNNGANGCNVPTVCTSYEIAYWSRTANQKVYYSGP